MNDIQLTEIREAIVAGEELLREIEIIEQSLHKAKTWGYIDLFSDSGLITSIFKHSRLHDAQNEMTNLQYCLDRFNSELNDVRVDNNLSEIALSKGIEIADWLLDGLIFDTYTLQRIYKSSKELKDLKIKVEMVLDNLKQIKAL